MRSRCGALAVAAAWLVVPAVAVSQSLTAETTITVGASSDDTAAAAAQARAFGDAGLGIRYYVEAAWARTGSESDAFGAAYPYRGRVQPIEAHAEWLASPGSAIVGVRAGRFRTPFGISSASDHAYTGFLRAPLIRYDGYYALSNNFLEHGVTAFAGAPRFTVEAGVGRPADVGAAVRRPGVDASARVQAAFGRAIVGVSHLRTRPYQSPRFAFGRTVFTGVDVRWMAGGVQLRGEWIGGRPFDDTSTTGWYADVLLHRRELGAVTLVGRVERLDYETIPSRALHARRETIGARVRVRDSLSLQVNVLHHRGLAHQARRVAADVGLTYSVRY
jgi:hypothetical protein